MKRIILTDTKRAAMTVENGQGTGYYVQFTVTNATEDGTFKAEVEYRLPNESGRIQGSIYPNGSYKYFDELYDQYTDKLAEYYIKNDDDVLFELCTNKLNEE